MCLTDGCSGSCWAERIWPGRGRRAPSRFISTPPPWFITLSFNPFSLEIKVSSCPCTSFRFLAPLADYSICLPQHYLTRVPASSRCPNMTTCFLVPALPATGPQHTHLWKWLSCVVKAVPSFHAYPASYELGFKLDSGTPWHGAWPWPPVLKPPKTLLLPFRCQQQRKASGLPNLLNWWLSGEINASLGYPLSLAESGAKAFP